jgi:hypothetical protein
MKFNLYEKWNLEKLPKSVPVDENFPDLINDPFVLAKEEKAEKLIAEYNLPKEWKKKTEVKNRRNQ